MDSSSVGQDPHNDRCHSLYARIVNHSALVVSRYDKRQRLVEEACDITGIDATAAAVIYAFGERRTVTGMRRMLKYSLGRTYPKDSLLIAAGALGINYMKEEEDV